MPGLLAALALRFDTVRQKLDGSEHPALTPAPVDDSQQKSLDIKDIAHSSDDAGGSADVYFWACMVSLAITLIHGWQ